MRTARVLRRDAGISCGVEIGPAFARAAALLLIGGTLHAQEVALPQPEHSAQGPPAAAVTSPSPAAATSPTATASATIPPPQLIPPDILPMPDPSAPPIALPPADTIQQLDEALKPKIISPAAQEYQWRIEWRKLRNRIENDPSVREARATADHARTDLEKRKLLARYYDVFYGKAIALAPEFKGYLNDRKRDALNALPQPRVRPESVPATPTPKPGETPPPPPASPPPAPPLPSATPTPSIPR
jgi:hypothetical protein